RGARFTFTLPVADQPGTGVTDDPAPLTARSSPRAAADQVRVLVVEDDPQTLRYVRDILAKAGFVPVVTGQPEEVLRLVVDKAPHLVLLDLVLPGSDGIELMTEILERADVPVIFLSAYGRDDVVAKALEQGAVDYIVKPFSPTELVARIRAALRNRAVAEPAAPFVLGDLFIDYAAHSVTVAGRPVQLTAIEYRLLVELAANAGRVLPYDRLWRRVWGEESTGDLRPMRTVVSSIRRKLDDAADNPTYIFTEPRIGYRMARGKPLA
ncbi:MAG: response regulator transcription factor, partial [Chloroflexota bacterium]|nr:response regulator transcription factor [Chloroflexota bacterium]